MNSQGTPPASYPAVLSRARRGALALSACLALGSGGLPVPAAAQSVSTQTPTPLQDQPAALGGDSLWDAVPWNLTASGGLSEDNYVVGAEMLAPLWLDSAGNILFFLYPEIDGGDGGAGHFGIGAGLRAYLPTINAIVGANAFYDYVESVNGNHFSGLGLGLELLSRWFDVHLNWQKPE
ncbi:MAG: hypothetical protein ACC661_12040, partial [Verrucomicrobiales bacterium]